MLDRIAIVTGAGSGIGKASAIRLAQEGAKVVCVDINKEAAELVAQEITNSSGEAYSAVCDISDSKACNKVVADCVTKYGSVDILVNNAGVNLPGVFHEVSD